MPTVIEDYQLATNELEEKYKKLLLQRMQLGDKLKILKQSLASQSPLDSSALTLERAKILREGIFSLRNKKKQIGLELDTLAEELRVREKTNLKNTSSRQLTLSSSNLASFTSLLPYIFLMSEIEEKIKLQQTIRKNINDLQNRIIELSGVVQQINKQIPKPRNVIERLLKKSEINNKERKIKEIVSEMDHVMEALTYHQGLFSHPHELDNLISQKHIIGEQIQKEVNDCSVAEHQHTCIPVC